MPANNLVIKSSLENGWSKTSQEHIWSTTTTPRNIKHLEMCIWSHITWTPRICSRIEGNWSGPTKAKAIIELPSPRNISKLKRLEDNLVYICRFISISGWCHPFSRLMKNIAMVMWEQQSQEASESTKTYLIKPLLLASPIKGKPLLLYTARSIS